MDLLPVARRRPQYDGAQSRCGADQNPRATARIARFSDDPANPFAIIDLSDAYQGGARLARRGLRLLGDRQLLIQDELICDSPADFWWFMHTTAKIQCEGATARLTLDGERLTARILKPSGARFQDLPAIPLPPCPDPAGQQGKGIHGVPKEAMRKLAIHLPRIQGEARVVVELTPATGKAAPASKAIVPLDQWRALLTGAAD